ncbi:MAG: hypothetical protein KF891_12715 [Rhizobacter sp.]|nr:hypothetical protein [Rhizobacter sp.]
MTHIGGKLLFAMAVASALGTAHADTEHSGQLRLRWDDRHAADTGPLAEAARLAPELIAQPTSAAALEGELRGRWQFVNAAVALREERPRHGAWHGSATVDELYASGEALGWQWSAGRKVVAWDVGYGFRPNDVVQQEQRRTLLPAPLQGRAVVQAEHFDARTAWSLVWVNPQRATDGQADTAYGAGEQALALRAYTQAGAADWHGFARYGQHTGASLGAAVSWVASDSVEVHASARAAERADVFTLDGNAPLLASTNPYRWQTRNKAAQALLGAGWTGETKLSLMAEWWYDSTAPSNGQWVAWLDRNHALQQAWFPGGPDVLRLAVAGNLTWQTQAFNGQSLRRNNVFLRAAWDHEGWQPSLDVLLMPADRGRVVTAALGWQGDRVRVDVGWRMNAGPAQAVVMQLPVRRAGYVAVGWAL